MEIGVSSGSLYPLHVEDAVAELARLGIRSAEVFANSTAEGNEPIISQIKKIKEENGMNLVSFHPFSSPMESVFLFSDYDRRIEEMLTMYRNFFKSMNTLGAKIFVLHGAILSINCSTSHYLRQFRLLAEIGREYGITVAQENVAYCLGGKLEFLRIMKRELGDYAKFVLDLKQARRSSYGIFDYVDALGSSIVHCHLSDGDDGHDCLPIGAGTFDFAKLHKRLAEHGYGGAYIIELYRGNYNGFDELRRSVDRLEEILDKS